MKFKDLTDMVFGLWTVIRIDHKSAKDSKYYYECRCSCGTISIIRSTSLTSGNSKSCGCNIPRGGISSRFKHGGTGERLHYIFCNIIQRCRNPNHNVYHRYGGRGMTTPTRTGNRDVLIRRLTPCLGRRYLNLLAFL